MGTKSGRLGRSVDRVMSILRKLTPDSLLGFLSAAVGEVPVDLGGAGRSLELPFDDRVMRNLGFSEASSADFEEMWKCRGVGTEIGEASRSREFERART
jgi:hypothetical protein